VEHAQGIAEGGTVHWCMLCKMIRVAVVGLQLSPTATNGDVLGASVAVQCCLQGVLRMTAAFQSVSGWFSWCEWVGCTDALVFCILRVKHFTVGKRVTAADVACCPTGIPTYAAGMLQQLWALP